MWTSCEHDIVLVLCLFRLQVVSNGNLLILFSQHEFKASMGMTGRFRKWRRKALALLVEIEDESRGEWTLETGQERQRASYLFNQTVDTPADGRSFRQHAPPSVLICQYTGKSGLSMYCYKLWHKLLNCSSGLLAS